MNQKELAKLTIDALNNPLNIYHIDCKHACAILAGFFGLTYEQCKQRIEEMAK